MTRLTRSGHRRQPRRYCNVDYLAHSKPIFWVALCDDREVRIDLYPDDFDSEDLLESLFPKSRGVVIAAQGASMRHIAG